MTGAKNFIAYPDCLRLNLPARFATKGINKVHIRLTPDDVYDVEFIRWDARALKADTVAKESEIYAESLTETFRQHTGLEHPHADRLPSPIRRTGG
ncbi:hypothetical protein KUV57_12630 [Epibacterium sp. DP7N7-1]|nr:hypothetical protein [Epibacterium sp. DP7N7-1]